MNYRRLIALAAFLSANFAFGQDEVRYVTDQWRFETRETPCWECTISRSLTSGTQLTILETDEEVEGWKYIRTANGHEGWMSERYMQETPSSSTRVEEAESQASIAATEQALLRDQFSLLVDEIQAAGIDIEMVAVSSEDGAVSVQAPHIVGNLATVGSQNEALLRSNQLLQNEVDLLSAEVDRLNDENWKKYFIYGGGAVFSGVILCLILTRIPRKRSYSEWA